MDTIIETHQQMKRRHSDEWNNLEGLFFAFNNEQMTEGMKKVGLGEKAYSEIVSIGAGGYLRKDARPAFKALIERHDAERKQLRKDEKKIVEGLAYELANHEYCITGDLEPAVNALGYSMDTIPENILKRAIKQHNEQMQNN